MNLVRRWQRQSTQRKLLFIEAGFSLARAAWQVRRWKFRRLASTLGVPAPLCGGSAASPPHGVCEMPAAASTVIDVRWAVHAWLLLLPEQPTCLMQAVAGRRMLARRGIACDIVFGVSTAPSAALNRSASVKLSAHAWLRHGAVVVTGAGEAERFQPIVMYQSPGAPARQPR